jgi:sulfopyruvate decarboxylase subunit beta
MIRKEAIKIIAKNIDSQPIVSANGYISRDLFEVLDKKSNFYMIGSMGLSSSIGLGIAIKNPKKRVYVFDGDGNILMNLGSLSTIGFLKPKNLIHFVFDNSIHESTGGQPTHTTKINIERIARATNYTVFKTRSKTRLEKILKKIKKITGPIFILVKIEKNNEVSKRVLMKPTEIRDRFMNSLR